MKKAVQKSLQGWAMRLGVVATGAVCCLSVLTPTASAAGSSVTQLKYLQTLAQLCGESAQFNASSKAADYVQWAKNKNMNLGWDTKAKLSSDVLAQSLVQLYGLNPRKYGGDYYRILEREGIVVERNASISSEALAALVDNPVVAQKTFQVAGTSTSPVKPGNGNGNGYGWYEHQAGIPKPPPPRGNGNGRGHLPNPR
jgi:hypothetical protein